jgi:hypothetical protein
MNKNRVLPLRLRELIVLILGALILISAPVRADDVGDLILAVSRNESYTLGKMLERGVDPNLKEETRGETALMVAIREKSMRSVMVLLASPKIDLEAASNNGDTALMIASYTDNLEAVRLLLDKDAEVNRHGWTALHYAAAVGSSEIVSLLLDKSAYIDAESPNRTTPLMMAARAGHTEVAKLLIDAGADVKLKNDQGFTAYDFAVSNERTSTAEFLKGAK